MQKYVPCATNKNKLYNSLITPVLSTKLIYELSKKPSSHMSTSSATITTNSMISKALNSTLIETPNIEERKCIFIQDEDEEDDLIEKENDIIDEDEEYIVDNTTSISNDYFEDDSPETGSLEPLASMSNNSSGYSTPKHESIDSPKMTSQQENFNAELLSSSLKSTIRATSAAFADLLSNSQKPKRRALGFSNFDLDEKRAFHILSERRRRYDLKNLFEDLRLSLPSLVNKQKASKVTILKTAVDHMVEMRNSNEKLKHTFQRETQRQKKLIEYLKNLEENNLNQTRPFDF